VELLCRFVNAPIESKLLSILRQRHCTTTKSELNLTDILKSFIIFQNLICICAYLSLQNDLHELWALLNFLQPDIFGSASDFDQIFNTVQQPSAADAPIVAKGQATKQTSSSSAAAAAPTDAQQSIINDEQSKLLLSSLHRLLRPFMLRRLKSQVETSLLPKKETLVYVGMSEAQNKLYKSILVNDFEALNSTGRNVQVKKLNNLLMQLRKAANHPYLHDGQEDMTLPQFGDHLVSKSGKMVVLDKLLLKLKAQGSRVLIFSQMTRMLDILDDYASYRQWAHCRIDGNTDQIAREEAMRVFNADDSPYFLFLLSTRAGGLGINLVTADIVILYDSDWNRESPMHLLRVD
jgi:SWI/SNF-related matrix-associated actin-dependent regulator of chromatin subfamily A member 5